MDPRPAPFPAHLQRHRHDRRTVRGRPRRRGPAARHAPPGQRGDLDILLAHTPDGIVATDDRCPHMSAPLSIGELDGCVVACPLHEGRFDLRSGETVQMPTTGGLDADGVYHPTWSTPGVTRRSTHRARRPRRAG